LGGPKGILSGVRSLLGRARSLDGGLGAVLGGSDALQAGVRALAGVVGTGCHGPGPVAERLDPAFQRRRGLDRDELLVGLALLSKFRVVVSKGSVPVALLCCVVALLCSPVALRRRSVALLRRPASVSFSAVRMRPSATSFGLVAPGGLLVELRGRLVAAGGLLVELCSRLVAAVRLVVAVASSSHGTSQMDQRDRLSLSEWRIQYLPASRSGWPRRT
jgi:hypothetical protein